jgi:hypothetical protein
MTSKQDGLNIFRSGYEYGYDGWFRYFFFDSLSTSKTCVTHLMYEHWWNLICWWHSISKHSKLCGLVASIRLLNNKYIETMNTFHKMRLESDNWPSANNDPRVDALLGFHLAGRLTPSGPMMLCIKLDC